MDVAGDSATFSWAAATGPVAGYSVLVSRNDEPFEEEATTAVDEVSTTVMGSPGETIAVRVQAFDAQGNTGPLSRRSQVVLFVTEEPGDPGDPGPGGSLAIQLSAQFTEPVYAAAAMEGDERLFVVERPGRIRILENGAIRPTPFLDIRTRVGTTGEGGLLGLAFDPDTALNGTFYVFYTDTNGDVVISRFESTSPNVADASSEEELLVVEMPSGTRLGGTLAFSPVDGFLYVGIGDGDAPGDPGNVSQDGSSLRGKLLRLDVSGGPGTPYAIPADNPFVGDPNALDEIWALGLGDPARFSFDWATGDLWIGDVGQDAREEIDYEPANGGGGRNYGWDVLEGTECNEDDPSPAPPCDDPSLTPPVFEYEHAEGNCSIVGGAVYRGPLAELEGQYFFGDLCSGRVWSLDRLSLEAQDSSDMAAPARAPFDLAAIVEDGFGALHTVHRSGRVFRVGPTGNECGDGLDNDGDGFTDMGEDPGCSSSGDASERDSDLVCDDGYDNDGDGRIDFPTDPGCNAPEALFERPPAEVLEEEIAAATGPGSSCGVGIELVGLLPPLLALYRRRRA